MKTTRVKTLKKLRITEKMKKNLMKNLTPLLMKPN
jgi:hypothetical protein